MNILAIDPATKCGWAYTIGGRVEYGTKDFSNSQWHGAGMPFLRFQKFLLETLHKSSFHLIAYERVERHTSTYAAHMYGGWKSSIQLVGEKLEVPYTGYTVQDIKKFWTGKGSAKKDAMINEANKRGFNPPDDNAADALAILHLAMNDYLWD